MLKALGLLLKRLFLKKPDQLQGPTLKEPACQTVRADQESEIHKGPKGGLSNRCQGKRFISRLPNSQTRQATSSETSSFQNGKDSMQG